MKWRLTRVVSLDERLKAMDTEFNRYASIKLMVKAADLMKDRPPSEWVPLALSGHYLASYERWYYRAWRGSRTAMEQVYDGITAVVDREGPDTTYLAINALFSDKSSWMQGDRVKVLVNVDMFQRHIVPILRDSLARLKKGEQSEWSGARSQVPTSGPMVLGRRPT